jgi:hypothetical protein
VSLPTPGEQDFAKRFKLTPESVAHARDVLNTIASLDWPLPERQALLARLARTAKADVGPAMAGLALAAAPVRSFETLIAVNGLADKRVFGLAKALQKADPASFSKAAAGALNAWAQLDALQAENLALRRELDRLAAAAPPPPGAPPPVDQRMRLEDMAHSIARQVALADQTLAGTGSGLRLGGVALEVRGRATTLDQDVAIDFATGAGAGGGGSSVGLSFTPARNDAANGSSGTVPDVTGYTPALARRKLEGQGFAVSVAATGGLQGRVAQQHPAAGSVAQRGALVRLVVR